MTQIRSAENVLTWQDAVNRAASVLDHAESKSYTSSSTGELAAVAMGWIQLATEIRGWQRP